MIRKLEFLLVATLAVLAACQTASAITVDDLYGTWQPDGTASVYQFNEDGTFGLFSSKYVLEGDPHDVGQFQLEGIVLTLTSSDEGDHCTSGRSGTYDVELTEAEQLQFTSIEDQCVHRREDIKAAPTWNRISP